MNKKEVVKGKNLFDEEKIIDTGIKEPLFVSIPFDEYRKLQKENEVLKEVHKEFATLCRELKTDDTLMSAKSVMEKVVSKDKIKEALGDENIPDEMILTYIDTLVSENNRLEDIEDKKVQIEYNNVFNKGVKSVEDKIRTKLEHAKEVLKNLDNEQDIFVQKIVINYLEELLGDE